MSDLETSIATIIAVFQKYSEREGDKHKLKKSELKDLLHDELPDLMAHVKDQSTLDGLMESLDADGDSECNFQEFMTFVSMVTVCCHEFFEHEEELWSITEVESERRLAGSGPGGATPHPAESLTVQNIFFSFSVSSYWIINCCSLINSQDELLLDSLSSDSTIN
uniref:S100 calcium binding protein, beta (neural) n=2 Tax=Xiphophorus maculatus TaxID=8083 RepID=M4A7L2_XIPMA